MRARLIATRRTATIAATLILIAGALAAKPANYLLQADRSAVAFETDYGGAGLKITGKMPVAKADLSLDFAHIAASAVTVEVNAAGATTSNPLATEAMTGVKVLDTHSFPTIHFQSTTIRATKSGADVSGNITIHGVTKPITMTAQFYRQQGTQAGDMRNLSILLTGAISRAAFGAGGFPDLVGDQVRLKILARIALDG